jgi:hypothetical protein
MHPERVPGFYEPKRHPRRKSVEQEEARAWARLYRRAGDVEVATEVLTLLEADGQTRHEHPALELRCRESLRRHKAWQRRRKHLLVLWRLLADLLVVTPALALRRWAMGSLDLAIACLQGTPPRRHARSKAHPSSDDAQPVATLVSRPHPPRQANGNGLVERAGAEGISWPG